MVTGHTSLRTAIYRGRRLACNLLRSGARALVSIAIGVTLCASASALIVGNVPGVVPGTNINPDDYAGWTQGDPGWDNVVAAGSNYVYLGDGWVLSARHVGYQASNGVTFQTKLPNGSPGPVETFYRIPGSYYFDYGYSQGSTRWYAVSNPTSIQSETGQTISLADSKGTFFTDLQLFRINGDPGLPSVTIASESLGSNFTRATAPEVVAVGRGLTRRAAETHWDVTENSEDDWTWTTTTGAGTHQSYRKDDLSASKYWGTNRLADPNPNGGGDPSDPGALEYGDLFEAVVSDTTSILELTTGDGTTRDVISMMTVYDNQSAPGSTQYEFQGINGNSGSGVFFKRGDDWELAGVINAIFTYPDQPWPNHTVYGNSTVISDLSYYNQDYTNSIKDIIESHPDYSHLGDLNLDGNFSGDGSGPPGQDDVTDFVVGWGYNNGTGIGTITSWQNGDLNHDGKTNVQDFLMLRGALNGEISSAVMAALFGDSPPGGDFEGGVPEPATAMLAGIAVAWFTMVARRLSAISS